MCRSPICSVLGFRGSRPLGTSVHLRNITVLIDFAQPENTLREESRGKVSVRRNPHRPNPPTSMSLLRSRKISLTTFCPPNRNRWNALVLRDLNASEKATSRIPLKRMNTRRRPTSRSRTL